MNNQDAILNSLYSKVDFFDDMQERMTEISIKLNKLEEEVNLYKSLNMPEVFEHVIFSIDLKTKSLELEKSLLENRIKEIDLDETLQLISQYESEISNI